MFNSGVLQQNSQGLKMFFVFWGSQKSSRDLLCQVISAYMNAIICWSHPCLLNFLYVQLDILVW